MDNTPEHTPISTGLRPKNPFTPPPGKLFISHAYIAEILADASLTLRELRLLLAIVDETVGWNRRAVTQRLGFWALRAGIHQKHVGAILATLAQKGWITWTRGAVGGRGLQGTINLIRYPQIGGSKVDITTTVGGGSATTELGRCYPQNGGTATTVGGGTYQVTINTLNTQSKGEGAFCEFPKELQTAAFKELHQEYVQHRESRKSPLIGTALKHYFRKMVKMGERRARAALTHTMAQGYVGVVEDPNFQETDNERVERLFKEASRNNYSMPHHEPSDTSDIEAKFKKERKSNDKP
jgi:hypothetical protein